MPPQATFSLLSVTLVFRGGTLLVMSGTFEVWAEPFGSPLHVFYEGEPYPMSEMDIIVGKIVKSLRSGEVRARWVGNRDE